MCDDKKNHDKVPFFYILLSKLIKFKTKYIIIQYIYSWCKLNMLIFFVIMADMFLLNLIKYS